MWIRTDPALAYTLKVNLNHIYSLSITLFLSNFIQKETENQNLLKRTGSEVTKSILDK
jgi:hypothetical protein